MLDVLSSFRCNLNQFWISAHFQETLYETNSQLKHIYAHLNESGKDSKGVGFNIKISSKKIGQRFDMVLSPQTMIMQV